MIAAPLDRLGDALARIGSDYVAGRYANVLDFEAAIDRYVACYAKPSEAEYASARAALARRAPGQGWTEWDARNAGIVRRYEADLSPYEAIQAGIR